MNRVELKTRAKNSLNGKYGDAIALMVISFVLSLAVSFITVLFDFDENVAELINSIASVVLSGLIGFGTFSYYLKVSRNEEVTFIELFNKANLFWPYIAISLLVGIFTFLWSLLFIIPGIIATLSYSLVFYIKLDNPELSVTDVISKSKQMMKGHKWDFFVLELSFLGWEILGIFTFGILYLWLVPYMQVTYANFYNEIKENNGNVK